jgi:hypothetical protein
MKMDHFKTNASQEREHYESLNELHRESKAGIYRLLGLYQVAAEH